jgi:Type I restriction modification DNA specificity domain
VPTVADLFSIRYGHNLELNHLIRTSRPDGVNFVSRTMSNNGVTARVLAPEGVYPAQPGELTVALGGSVLTTFVQPEPFIVGRDVAILTARDHTMSVPERLWWSQCISANRYRYNYGRQANRTLASLMLPEDVPDYVQKAALPDFGGAASAARSAKALPPAISWGSWRLNELFGILKGSRLTKRERRPGTVPFVGTSTANNGIVGYVPGPAQFPAWSITVPYNGVGGVAYAFLQREAFCASDDINVLIPFDTVSAPALLFVCVVLRHERYRYSYGRKWNLERMNKSSIKLPAAGEHPDWKAMANFIMGLPFSEGAKVALTR